MRNEKKTVVTLAKFVAEKALCRDANRTTCSHIYQPKAPSGLNRFKKGSV